ncbi:hypothetical protein [Streptomyces sp. NPDC052535]|uniref:hypothetical protein n=1 Tax=Streptomyces sp. NPDC052535 TaxID=3155531 RepID=UPI003421F8B7
MSRVDNLNSAHLDQLFQRTPHIAQDVLARLPGFGAVPLGEGPAQRHGEQLMATEVETRGLAVFFLIEGGERHADKDAEARVVDRLPVLQDLSHKLGAHHHRLARWAVTPGAT